MDPRGDYVSTSKAGLSIAHYHNEFRNPRTRQAINLAVLASQQDASLNLCTAHRPADILLQVLPHAPSCTSDKIIASGITACPRYTYTSIRHNAKQSPRAPPELVDGNKVRTFHWTVRASYYHLPMLMRSLTCSGTSHL